MKFNKKMEGSFFIFARRSMNKEVSSSQRKNSSQWKDM